MCLSNGGVTLRNGHSAHIQNGLPLRTGTASRADRNGRPARLGASPGLVAETCGGRRTFMNEAREYGPNC